MSFLEVFKIPIPVFLKATSSESLVFNEDLTTFSGSIITQKNKSARNVSVRTPPLTKEDALFFEGLCSGDFEHFSLDTDAWSSSGKSWSFSTGSFLAGAPFGGASLAGFVLYDVNLKPKYSASVWAQSNGVWDHYFTQSDGTTYKNGVATAPLSWFALTSVSVSLNNIAPFTNFRDLVVYNFLWPKSKIEIWWVNYGISNYMQNKLSISGTSVDSFNAEGFVSAKKNLGAIIGDIWHNNLSELSITLVEA